MYLDRVGDVCRIFARCIPRHPSAQRWGIWAKPRPDKERRPEFVLPLLLQFLRPNFFFNCCES